MNHFLAEDLSNQWIESLTRADFLAKIQLNETELQFILQKTDWPRVINQLLEQGEITCREVLNMMTDTLAAIGEAPIEGWLTYSYRSTLNTLFPNTLDYQPRRDHEAGKFIYLEALRLFLIRPTEEAPFGQSKGLALLSEEESKGFLVGEEYLRLMNYAKANYLPEFMRLAQVCTPFDTLGHIAGVHRVAMHMARGLYQAKIPIDLALVSGAAFTHDLGKFGCKPSEAKRVPYLHYYYTDQFLKRNGFPIIGHIASNHSVWDLELENLSVESLVLIYADFKVRAKIDAQGQEQVIFYSLQEAFQVILHKLDHVDQAKKDRYQHVYAKLMDFEDYMVSLGISTDLSTTTLCPVAVGFAALYNEMEVVQAFKNLAITHNIFLMHTLSSERAYGNILEGARSEEKWKNIRAYLNIIHEYSTYMTQKQKTMTMHFLYELLMHREGDIRRQAADLLGNIIAHYDVLYPKALPEGVVFISEETTALNIWQAVIQNMIVPDHKIITQHKRWMGYTLKILVESVLKRCPKEMRAVYLAPFLLHFSDLERDEATAFILLDAILTIPLTDCSQEQVDSLLDFAMNFASNSSLEVKISALRFIRYVLKEDRVDEEKRALIGCILDKVKGDGILAVAFLKQHIQCHLSFGDRCFAEVVYADKETLAILFLENLKAATPWVVKLVNIELLLERAAQNNTTDILQVATHFANIVKVGEKVTVRHCAGEALLQIAKYLSWDQCNEVVIELTKGLEIGEYEFSKYIPQYLGELALYLHPNELDEILRDLAKLLTSSNDRVASVTLNTLGVMIQKYALYKERFPENESIYKKRKTLILGMILKGLADYRESVSQEAFLVIGESIFGSMIITLEEKYEIFQQLYKKMLTLIEDYQANKLSFFHHATALNHIYRFISDYSFQYGYMTIDFPQKVAFFPGTFDPFSLSHLGMVEAMVERSFEVYLALDEFSWSKKTQPKMIRHQIARMSVADQGKVYLFPDEIPINLANADNLKTLKGLFPGRALYIVAGSDVLINASAYKSLPGKETIHSFNHLVFKRQQEIMDHSDEKKLSAVCGKILGEVEILTLPLPLADISSTKIRENIDCNRDISNLVDPMVQNYIYEQNLYLRESRYKHIFQASAIEFTLYQKIDAPLADEILQSLASVVADHHSLAGYLLEEGTMALLIRNGERGNKIVGLALFHRVSLLNLYNEFKNVGVSTWVREHACGKIVTITGLFTMDNWEVTQWLLTEVLAFCLRWEYGYALYQGRFAPKDAQAIAVCERQGFVRIGASDLANPVYEVMMRAPVTLLEDTVSIIKAPFNTEDKVIAALDRAHQKLQLALNAFYPGELVLSFDEEVMQHKLMGMITKENEVSQKNVVGELGSSMCVPFGQILRGVVVPNTVTKALHTEKTFDPEIRHFEVKEFPFYSPLRNQVKTIHSFNRPVILVDDVLHKGYRIKALDPIFRQEEVPIRKILVGIMSGHGRDLANLENRAVDSVYFVPNLKNWLVESALYPFLGGDRVERANEANANLISSINFILPYVTPSFLTGVSGEALYQFSLVCLENTKDILQTLEEAYCSAYERNLTLSRLSEVIHSPRTPDEGLCMSYDLNLAPSVYVNNDLEKLRRLRGIMLQNVPLKK